MQPRNLGCPLRRHGRRLPRSVTSIRPISTRLSASDWAWSSAHWNRKAFRSWCSKDGAARNGSSTCGSKAGPDPAGPDEAWGDNLLAAIYSWSGSPAAPPRPPDVVERPPLPVAGVPGAPREPSLPLTFFQTGWHSCFGGQEWRCDAGGIYTRESDPKPLRTAGQPVTIRRIWDLFGELITQASQTYGVDRALIMMVIATEAGAYRDYGFTGPMTFRWEPNVKVTDISPVLYGDYSAGPMQILATTARDVVRRLDLAYDPLRVAPPFESRPAPPMTLPLYEAPTNIDIGTAVISQSWSHTGADPILVAAAYNAGGVYESDANTWRIRSSGNHLDRAARWYGDACQVLKEMNGGG